MSTAVKHGEQVVVSAEGPDAERVLVAPAAGPRESA
ncbi:HPr family phosphocarrier protein [Streptomyces sp. 5-10]|nr:HPr family phosphocarrier protein [Streptomyces sp. 5-10]